MPPTGPKVSGGFAGAHDFLTTLLEKFSVREGE